MWDFYVRQMEDWKERWRDKTPQSIFSIELKFFEDLFGFQYSIPTVAGKNLDTVLYLLASICASLKKMEPAPSKDENPFSPKAIANDYFEGYKQLVINALNQKIGNISRLDLIKSHFKKNENASKILMDLLKDKEISAGVPQLLTFLDLEPNLLARIAVDSKNINISNMIADHLKGRGENAEAARIYYSVMNKNALASLAKQEKADKPDKRRFITKFFSPNIPDITCRFYNALAQNDSAGLTSLFKQNPRQYKELFEKENPSLEIQSAPEKHLEK